MYQFIVRSNTYLNNFTHFLLQIQDSKENFNKKIYNRRDFKMSKR